MTSKKAQTQVYEVAFMPYARFEKGFELGDFEIWPFYSEGKERIKDEKVYFKLEKYFGRYKEYDPKGYEKDLESINIVTPKHFKIGKDMLSKRHKRNIRSISHIITFVTIFEHDFEFTSAETFIVYFQKFKAGTEGMKIWNICFSSYNLFKILKPINTSQGSIFLPTTEFGKALGEALEHRFKNDKVRRIFSSLEYIYYALAFSDMVTDEFRILLLLMAFQALLKFENKVGFATELEKCLKLQNSKKFRRKTSEGIREFSLTGWWAYDLYDLRNKIVHVGNNLPWKIKEYGNVWSRIMFGGILLCRLYKNFLHEVGLYNLDIFEFEHENTDEILENIVKEYTDI